MSQKTVEMEHGGQVLSMRISERLQQELPGLRGFSSSNIKNMRLFYEEWAIPYSNRQPVAGDLNKVTREIDIYTFVSNRLPAANDLTTEQIKMFLSIGFSHH